MHEFATEVLGVERVLFGSESHKACNSQTQVLTIVENVNSERVEAAHQHIDSQIVLQAVDQVRLHNIFASNIAPGNVS